LQPKRVSIPLLGGEVAPRFCFAREMLLVKVAEGRVADRQQLDVADRGWRERLPDHLWSK